MGRGQGAGSTYKPWLTIQDVPLMMLGEFLCVGTEFDRDAVEVPPVLPSAGELPTYDAFNHIDSLPDPVFTPLRQLYDYLNWWNWQAFYFLAWRANFLSLCVLDPRRRLNPSSPSRVNSRKPIQVLMEDLK